MRKSIFAVCDLETDYAQNFMAYLLQKKSIPFEIQAFTSVERLIEFSGKEHIEILLISDKAMKPEVRNLKVEKLIILSEGVHCPELDQYSSVYKYQSSDTVIREVMACYGESCQNREMPQVVKKPVEWIGVFTPADYSSKTLFGLALGQILAKEKAVLYLNLDPYAGLEELFLTSYDKNLGDLLYYLRQGNEQLIHKLMEMVQSMSNMDFLPPAVSPMDVTETGYDQWRHLMEEIERYSSYETVIIDFSESVQGLYQLMEKCRTVYMPVVSDAVSAARVLHFEKIMQMWEKGVLEEKIRKIKLPYFSSEKKGGDLADELVWSQLGDYVRQLLKERD